MEVKALTKFARMSDKKVREIAREIQGRNAAEALEVLKLVSRKSTRLVAKTLTSAIANAENNFNMDGKNLYVSECYVCPGPTLKRMMPRARGSADRILKRTSHMTIVVKERV